MGLLCVWFVWLLFWGCVVVASVVDVIVSVVVLFVCLCVCVCVCLRFFVFVWF